MVVFCHLTIIWNQSKQLFENLKTYELQERQAGRRTPCKIKRATISCGSYTIKITKSKQGVMLPDLLNLLHFSIPQPL